MISCCRIEDEILAFLKRADIKITEEKKSVIVLTASIETAKIGDEYVHLDIRISFEENRPGFRKTPGEG